MMLRAMKPQWASKIDGRLSRLTSVMASEREELIIDACQEVSQRIGNLFLNRSYDLTSCCYTINSKQEPTVAISIPVDEEFIKITLQCQVGTFTVTMQFPDVAYCYIAGMASRAVYQYGLEAEPVLVDDNEMGTLQWRHINAACAMHFAGVDWQFYFDGWVGESPEIPPVRFN